VVPEPPYPSMDFVDPFEKAPPVALADYSKLPPNLGVSYIQNGVQV